jgi:SPP1 gp7 family putative phage head morphogenesis protein
VSEEQLRDAILRGALLLQMLSNAKAAEADAVLVKLAQDLRMLLGSRTLSEAGKAEINALLRQADEAIQPAYAEAAATVDTHALALVVADKTVKALEDVLPANIATPTAERLASLTKDVLIDGAPSSAWWSKQGEDTAFKFAAAVRQGVINGETNEKIVARVVDRGAGILDTARRNARALVHSSVMAAANDARLATFRKNARLIAGVRWLSTLDSHTCVQCAALDGQAWDLDGAKLKGTEIDFMAPPAHFSCRCVLSPIPKTFADIGLDIPEPEETGQRASSDGPVSVTTTFSAFLKRQSPAFIENTLGKRRAELFEAGKITLTDLVTGSGRELTLSELEAHI